MESWSEEQDRWDRRAALAPWMIATVNTKKGYNAPKMMDFMPKKPTTREDLRAKLDAFATLPGVTRTLNK